MSEELKACPFCGGEAKVSHYNGKNDFIPNGRDKFCIYCLVCRSAKGGYHPHTYGTLKEAFTAWNSRPVEDTLRTKVTELEAEIVDRADTELSLTKELVKTDDARIKAEAEGKKNLERYLEVSSVLNKATGRADLGSTGMAKLLVAKAEAMQKALKRIANGTGRIGPRTIAKEALKDKPTGGDDAN